LHIKAVVLRQTRTFKKALNKKSLFDKPIFNKFTRYGLGYILSLWKPKVNGYKTIFAYVKPKIRCKIRLFSKTSLAKIQYNMYNIEIVDISKGF